MTLCAGTSTHRQTHTHASLTQINCAFRAKINRKLGEVMGANKPSRTNKKIGWQQHNEALTEKYVKSTNAGARKKSHSPAAPCPFLQLLQQLKLQPTGKWPVQTSRSQDLASCSAVLCSILPHQQQNVTLYIHTYIRVLWVKGSPCCKCGRLMPVADILLDHWAS